MTDHAKLRLSCLNKILFIYILIAFLPFPVILIASNYHEVKHFIIHQNACSTFKLEHTTCFQQALMVLAKIVYQTW